MEVLNYLFKILEPEHGVNWLSKKYHAWKYKKRDYHNKRFKARYKDVTYFKIIGAEEICLSNNPDHRCGGANGFSFSAGWGDSTFWHGGVIHKKEAERLAYFILNNLKQTKITIMKTNEQLIKEIEDIGVFIYENGKYVCTGYYLNETEAFVKLHKELIALNNLSIVYNKLNPKK